MNPETRYILVNHQSPDFDSIATTYLWIIANGLHIGDDCMEYAFVPPGKRYFVKDLDPNTRVVHLDTGGKLGRFDFDHHQNRRRWPSAARTVYERFPHLRRDTLVGDIVALTDKVDSGSAVNAEDADARKLRMAFNEQLKEYNNGREEPIILVTEQPGPWEIVDLVANIEIATNEVQDEEKLAAGLFMLESWHKSQQRKKSQIAPELLDRLVATYLTLCGWGEWPKTSKEREAVHKQFQSFNTNASAPSISQSVLDRNEKLRSDPLLIELVEFVNHLTMNGDKFTESEKTKEFKQLLASNLDEFNAGRENKVLPVVLRKWPWEILSLFPDDSYPAVLATAIGLLILRAWYNKKTIRRKVQKLLESANITKASGLNFALLPETTLTSKVIRYQLRRYYRDEIDVVVATYRDMRNNTFNLGVTRVQDNRLNGMDVLYQRLKEMDPSAEIFLFRPSKFVIYIKGGTTLTPQVVIEQARAILRPIAIDECKPEYVEGIA